MVESQRAGVKRLPVQRLQRLLGRVRQLLGLGLEAAAIDAVAKQWMADMGEMHTNLMRAPRLQLAGDQAGYRFLVTIGAEFFK